jgi:hypothetical protein
MVAEPVEIPLTIPFVAFTAATAVLSLDQVPPEVEFVYVVEDPTQTLVAPTIGLKI